MAVAANHITHRNLVAQFPFRQSPDLPRAAKRPALQSRLVIELHLIIRIENRRMQTGRAIDAGMLVLPLPHERFGSSGRPFHSRFLILDGFQFDVGIAVALAIILPEAAVLGVMHDERGLLPPQRRPRPDIVFQLGLIVQRHLPALRLARAAALDAGTVTFFLPAIIFFSLLCEW